MTDKELKKLRRSELLEMLIAQEKENVRLREELEQAKIRRIEIRNAGSIAEAALKLQGVFEAADAAAKQYVESVTRASASQKEDCDRIIAEAQAEAKRIIEEAEAEKQRKLDAADEYWSKMTDDEFRSYLDSTGE